MTRAMQWRRARDFTGWLAMVGFGVISVFGLGGCQAIEAIFKVGAWFGALVVVAIVAVIGGIAFLATKK